MKNASSVTNTLRFEPAQLEQLADNIFRAVGASAREAQLVAAHLVQSNLAGHDSHGVMRILQYVESIDHIKSSPPAPGVDEILVPGEFEHRQRQARSRDGIEIPDANWQAIVSTATRLGVHAATEAAG